MRDRADNQFKLGFPHLLATSNSPEVGPGDVSAGCKGPRSGRSSPIQTDANGDPYRVAYQTGNRWLDDHRLVFWDLNLGNAFLWDTESETASQIAGIDELGEFEYSADGEEFVFSEDGRTLYRLRTTVDSDIWLLEMSK